VILVSLVKRRHTRPPKEPGQIRFAKKLKKMGCVSSKEQENPVEMTISFASC